MATVHIRDIVDDVDAAVRFYTTHLGVSLLSSAACGWRAFPKRCHRGT